MFRFVDNCDRHAAQGLNQVSRLQVTTPRQPESVPKPPLSQVYPCGADVLQIFRRALVATAAGSDFPPSHNSQNVFDHIDIDILWNGLGI